MHKARPINAICKNLELLLATSPSDTEEVNELAREVAEHPEGIQAVRLLLSLLERNDHIDWGSPGPVVHAVESFFSKGYETLLLESVHRAPTWHTLWMANRVLNGSPKDKRSELLTAMREAAIRSDVTERVRQAAISFLKQQEGG